MKHSDKVTISLSHALWHAFRIACVQRKVAASKEIQKFIAYQLAVWEGVPQRETECTLVFGTYGMETLQAFHHACQARHLSASLEVEEFMRAQVATWHPQASQEDTDHA